MIGEALATMGRDLARAQGDRLEKWRAAKVEFASALKLIEAMRANGTLAETDATTVREITNSIADCDSAIAQLEGEQLGRHAEAAAVRKEFGLAEPTTAPATVPTTLPASQPQSPP
jgi:hypothetical protein